MTNSKWPFWSSSPSTLKRRPSRGARFRPALEQLEYRCLMTADIVLQWNAVALRAGVIDHTPAVANLPGLSDQPGSGAFANGGPTRTARALAIVQAAIYDAVNSVDRT